jgi:hypothetical protein
VARPPVAPSRLLIVREPGAENPCVGSGRVHHSEVGLLDELVSVRRPAAVQRRPKQVAAVSGPAPHGARQAACGHRSPWEMTTLPEVLHSSIGATDHPLLRRATRLLHRRCAVLRPSGEYAEGCLSRSR